MSKKIVNIYRIFIAFLVMTIMSVTALTLRLISLGLLTNFNRKYYVPFFCHLILKAVGIKVDNQMNFKQPKAPHFYTFNHHSYLDGFVLMSLGLTNARFLLSEKMIKYIPLTITAFSIGLLFIPTKKHRERRLRFFLKLEKRLKREKISLVASSEGVHTYKLGMSEFNRGVYHTAMLCNLPIVAIYIYTPVESNPFNDFRPFKSGTIKMELLDIIPTSNWKLEELEVHISQVRQKFVDRYNELHKTNTK